MFLPAAGSQVRFIRADHKFYELLPSIMQLPLEGRTRKISFSFNGRDTGGEDERSIVSTMVALLPSAIHGESGCPFGHRLEDHEEVALTIRWLSKPVQEFYQDGDSAEFFVLLAKLLLSILGVTWLSLCTVYCAIIGVLYCLGFVLQFVLELLMLMLFLATGMIASPWVLGYYHVEKADHAELTGKGLKVLLASCFMEMIVEDAPQIILQSYNSAELGQGSNPIYIVSVVLGSLFIMKEFYEAGGEIIYHGRSIFELDQGWKEKQEKKKKKKKSKTSKFMPQEREEASVPRAATLPTVSDTASTKTANTWTFWGLEKYLWSES